MRILVSYRGIPQSPGWATGDLVAKAFRKLGHEVDIHAKFYQKNLWVESNPIRPEYDLFLFLECNDGDEQYLNLKQIHARRTACWFFDTSYYPDHLQGLQQYFGFDLQFIANPLELGYFPNAYHMPYACDRELHGRELVTKKRHVALVGSDRQDRRDLQSRLRFAGIEMDIISNVFRADYINALAESEYVINQNPAAGRGLFNMRQYEAPAAGSIILTEGQDYDANEGEFQHLVNCLVYYNPKELVDLIHTVDKNKSEKENIRIAGQNHVLKHHTYEARCREILELAFPNEAT